MDKTTTFYECYIINNFIAQQFIESLKIDIWPHIYNSKDRV
jgi:hypothetical protein